MVMGPTHAMSGAGAGLAIGAFLPVAWGGATSATEVFVFAGVTAGAALVPALDTPQSTLARSFGPGSQALAHLTDRVATTWCPPQGTLAGSCGPVSQALAHLTERVSTSVYSLTSTRKDTRITNGHRTATHTLWFAFLAGAGTAALVSSFGKNAAVGVLFFMLGLALRGLAPDWSRTQDWLYVTGLSLALAGVAWFALPAPVSSTAPGAAVATGVVVHPLGDRITTRGVPLLGGIVRIGGK